MQIFYRLFNHRVLFATGIVVLAIHPLTWLVGTWLDPVYGSHGFPIAGFVLGLFLWSATSPENGRMASGRRYAPLLLGLTAGMRFLGQVLGINVIGALTLVVDVYALGLLLGLSQRRRALAPGGLALLFAFSLPLERIVQRTLGFVLQQLSAAGACQALSLGIDSVQCHGVRILLAGQDVLVDLPCSGARGLLLLSALYAALVALIRPSLPGVLAGLIVTLAAGFVANVVRIAGLALGLAYSHRLGGIEVLEAPWHEAIGFVCLAIGAAPLLVWAKAVVAERPDRIGAVMDSVASVEPCHPMGAEARLPRLLGGMGFAFATAVIISVPAHPVDVARAADPIALPASIAGLAAQIGELSGQERAYFTRYGGSAARAVYGPFALLVVSTSAPLRHLHAPDECLAGSGHRVRYAGARYGHLPTAVYRSVDPQGRRWRVAVTFVSDRGERATSVAEAVWRWLQRPATNWTMVQRIAPWGTPPSALEAWDTAVARALDLPISLTYPLQEKLP